MLLSKLESNEVSTPEVTYCIRVSNDLRVRLFYKSMQIALPQWFRKETLLLQVTA